MKKDNSFELKTHAPITGLGKNFDFAKREQVIYQIWQEAGAFRIDNPQQQVKQAEAYTIMIPPPNVTGSLHMGHALNNTLQDILIRYHRQKGYKTHWQVGTDHASIATQQVVERKLAEQQLPSRKELGRTEFLKKVWQWKEESGGNITNQLRRLGASPDWQQERFTMDQGLNHAVNYAFTQLYQAGIIYKAKKLVNWDPKMETAISDLEVLPKEVMGHMWYFHYPLLVGDSISDETITVATTRPETMLGDTAVAVNPNDSRYQHYIGRYALQPITQKKLLIIADDMVEPTAGSGALKVTPAHDMNDFILAQKHQLEMIEIFTKTACIRDDVTPAEYRGLDRYSARKKIVADMTAKNYLVKIEAIKHTVPYGDRGGVPIEPMLTEQWFCDAKKLAEEAIKVVRAGKITFIPENWRDEYFRWLENIEPWCISRQLWWGHRIPAYYAADGKVFVAETLQQAEAEAEHHYGKKTQLQQDEDVLDTWFSSALWPFSTLGWHNTMVAGQSITAPAAEKMLQQHFPTNLLVTGFDIIFFWVARMVMLSCYFMQDVPFRYVYVHALVRDEKGQKMSKSKGNVIDPLSLIDEFGADAVRLTLTSLASPGRDIKLSTERVRGYRNFITKLWNAAKLVEKLAGKDGFSGKLPTTINHAVNGWVLRSWQIYKIMLEQALETYRFDYYANYLHQFFWRKFCDWYLELIKPILNNPQHRDYAETQTCLHFCFREILKLAQPVIPFVTEELYQQLYGYDTTDDLKQNFKTDNLLCNLAWQSDYDKIIIDQSIQQVCEKNFEQVELATKMVEVIRSLRVNLGLGADLPLAIRVDKIDDKLLELAMPLAAVTAMPMMQNPKDLGRQLALSLDATKGVVLHLALPNDLDLEKMQTRLQKELQRISHALTSTQNKMANPEFMAKAKPEIKEEMLARESKLLAEQTILLSAQKALAE